MTAREILAKNLLIELPNRNIVLTYVETRWILAAMKEAVEVGINASFDKTRVNRDLNSILAELFPETKPVHSEGIKDTSVGLTEV